MFTLTLPIYRSSLSEAFLEKGVLKICSKFIGEHPYRSAIWTPFPKNTSEGLLLYLKKFHDIISIVLIFSVLLNALSFYLNKWSELNWIEKDELPKFSDWKCSFACCNFILLEWIEILSLVRKGYVELFEFLNQKGDYGSFSFYNSIHKDFFPKKHLRLIPLQLRMKRKLLKCLVSLKQQLLLKHLY